MKLKAAFAVLFGDALAAEVFRRLPQRPLRGRWGSVTRAEAAILLAGFPRLAQAYKLALCDKKKRSKKQAGEQTDGFLGDDAGAPGDDADYHEREGKWMADAMVMLFRPAF